MFAVRTPTAVVTDLGTEFGVDVAANGETESQVFQGKVVLTALDAAGDKQSGETILAENESARVKVDGQAPARVVVLRHENLDAASFVRVLPPPNLRPKLYFDENFNDTPATLQIGKCVGKHFDTWGYTSGNGRVKVVLGQPSGTAALRCAVYPQSSGLIEMFSAWQYAFRPFGKATTRLTFVLHSGIGGLEKSPGVQHRKWVGLRECGRFAKVSNPMGVPGFYVTLALDATHPVFGSERQKHGNVIFVDPTGKKTFLAGWDWDKYNGDNEQTVVITLTDAQYQVELSDPGIKNLTGSLSGDLPTKCDYLAQAVAYCQGIAENAGLCIDRIRVERMAGESANEKSKQVHKPEQKGGTDMPP